VNSGFLRRRRRAKRRSWVNRSMVVPFGLEPDVRGAIRVAGHWGPDRLLSRLDRTYERRGGWVSASSPVGSETRTPGGRSALAVEWPRKRSSL
jgi:hypothetical protein